VRGEKNSSWCFLDHLHSSGEKEKSWGATDVLKCLVASHSLCIWSLELGPLTTATVWLKKRKTMKGKKACS